MNPTPVTVVAIMKAKPGQEENLRQALLALIPPTRVEPGCINYDLHVAAEDPGKFLFFENWTTKIDLDTHLANTHLREFGAKADALLAAPPEITLWSRIG
ncbi:MAG: antibiotic biosynthesis monooxygenase [Verrucomicrobiales bacterium]|nr:antibiotic biosynthesis monooxygenase [Verrucomicrobiales bacterium]